MQYQLEQTTTHDDHTLQQLPVGYTMRPPTLDDVSATVAMLNASSLDTVGTPQFTEEEFRADWQEPGFNLATDSRAEQPGP